MRVAATPVGARRNTHAHRLGDFLRDISNPAGKMGRIGGVCGAPRLNDEVTGVSGLGQSSAARGLSHALPARVGRIAVHRCRLSQQRAGEGPLCVEAIGGESTRTSTDQSTAIGRGGVILDRRALRAEQTPSREGDADVDFISLSQRQAASRLSTARNHGAPRHVSCIHAHTSCGTSDCRFVAGPARRREQSRRGAIGHGRLLELRMKNVSSPLAALLPMERRRACIRNHASRRRRFVRPSGR